MSQHTQKRPDKAERNDQRRLDPQAAYEEYRDNRRERVKEFAARFVEQNKRVLDGLAKA